MKEDADTEFQESNSELPLSEVLSAKELQKIRHERRKDTIRKNSKTKSGFNSAEIWANSWGFDWAG